MVKHTLEFDAVLFDMDGTLLDSTPVVNAAWRAVAAKHGLDAEALLAKAHGVQTHMTLRKWLPEMDEATLKTEVQRFELGIIDVAHDLMASGKESLVVLPGVTRLLNELRAAAAEGTGGGPERMAIVTSASKAYALAAMDMLSDGIGQLPSVVVTSDDLSKGKPNPDPYLEGARRLGLDPARCLVIEDAPAGSISGLSAGCQVLGVNTGHDGAALRETRPTFFVDDLTSVSAALVDEKLLVTIEESI